MIKKHWFMCALSLISVFLFAQSVHAIGISPSVFNLGELVTTSVIRRNVIIVRGNPSEAEYYQITKEGSGAPYVKASTEVITLPQGQQQVKVPIEIAPASAAEGVYETTLTFNATEKTTDNATQGSVNRATVALSTQIKFSVSNKQRKEFSILSAITEETEENLPIVFSYAIRNSGNIDARPDAITVRFVDQTDPKHILEETVNGNQLPIVAPSDQKTIPVSLAGRLPKGIYDGKYEFFNGKTSIFVQSGVLRVHPTGTLEQQADLLSFSANKVTAELGEIIALEASVKNTGQLPVEGTVIVGVEQDGKRIDVLKSDKKVITQKQEGVYSFDWKPERSGTYILSAYAEYGIKKTPAQTITITVKGGFGGMREIVRIVVGVLLGLVVLGALWWILKKFIRR